MTDDAPPAGAPGGGATSGGAGTLWIVSTSLGNDADLSSRAIEVLRKADLVVAEDTRSARRLLASIGSERPTLSCFDANEAARADEIAGRLRAGARVALISEAGTPAVSDPGFRVVRAAVAAGARVVPVPGPSALLAALVASGLPTDRFAFLGFLPRKSGGRRRALEPFRRLPLTLVLYESPMRTAETLADLAAILGAGRPACLARELTKTHEELVRGTLGELEERYRDGRPLGEVTLVVGPAEEGAEDIEETARALGRRAEALLAAGHSARDAARLLAEESGRPRREAYAAVMGRARNGKG